jgi:hypothetical protein
MSVFVSPLSIRKKLGETHRQQGDLISLLTKIKGTQRHTDGYTDSKVIS